MTLPRFNLIVLRVADMERAAAFFGRLGLAFEKHSHGSGPLHFACEWNGIVLELYMATAEQPVSKSTRIGFAVADVDAAAASLTDAGGTMVVAPKDSEWGRRAVVTDLDGHRIEIIAGDPKP